jgi:hypothetical protein
VGTACVCYSQLFDFENKIKKKVTVVRQWPVGTPAPDGAKNEFFAF